MFKVVMSVKRMHVEAKTIFLVLDPPHDSTLHPSRLEPMTYSIMRTPGVSILANYIKLVL